MLAPAGLSAWGHGMPDEFRDNINLILRDHEGYTGDGQGGVGELPVGDRSTAPKPILKRDLREALFAYEAVINEAETYAEAAGESAEAAETSAASLLDLVNTTQSETATTKLMRNGDHGVGGVDSSPDFDDIDAAGKARGMYRTAPGASGSFPAGVNKAGSFLRFGYDNNDAGEFFVPNDSGASLHFRQEKGGNFEDWKTLVELRELQRSIISQDFQEDGKYWSRQADGAPDRDFPLTDYWAFVDTDRGRAAQIGSLNDPRTDWIVPRGAILAVPGRRYRFSITARKQGTVTGSGALRMYLRTLDRDYTNNNIVAGIADVPLTTDWQTFSVDWTADDSGAYLRPTVYRSSTASGAGTIQVLMAELEDVTDLPAELEGVLEWGAAVPTRLIKQSETGDASVELKPEPQDGTSLAQVTLFRDTDTSGERRVVFYRGDGTADYPFAEFSTDGNNFVCAPGDVPASPNFAIGAEGSINTFKMLVSRVNYLNTDGTDLNNRLMEIAADGDHGGEWGPIVDLIRGGNPTNRFTPDIDPPSDGDPLGVMRFTGRNDEFGAVTYSYLHTVADEVAEDSERGRLVIGTAFDGTLAPRFNIRGGLYAHGKNDPGAGNMFGTNVSASNRLMSTSDGTATYRTPGTGQTAGQIILRTDTTNRTLEIETTADGVKYAAQNTNSGAAADHVFESGGAEGLRILPDGIRINGGSDTLEAYEAGDWNPELSDGTNDATLSTSTGTYTRIGNMVHVRGRVTVSSLGALSGGVRIAGLPFPVKNASSSQSGSVVPYLTSVSLSTVAPVFLFTQQGSDFAYLQQQGSGGFVGLDAADLTNTTDIRFDLTYTIEP